MGCISVLSEFQLRCSTDDQSNYCNVSASDPASLLMNSDLVKLPDEFLPFNIMDDGSDALLQAAQVGKTGRWYGFWRCPQVLRSGLRPLQQVVDVANKLTTW